MNNGRVLVRFGCNHPETSLAKVETAGRRSVKATSPFPTDAAFLFTETLWKQIRRPVRSWNLILL
jgi:hypothetical protein